VQYVSIRYTERLANAGIEPSVGSVGDSYDNALAETVIGLFKTEMIRRRGPWRHAEAVEFATLEWVDWFNHRRLLEPIGNIPPAEAEARYHAQIAGQENAEISSILGSGLGKICPVLGVGQVDAASGELCRGGVRGQEEADAA
jgi:hypothetical protein